MKNQDQVMQEVKKVQTLLDAVVPGKVKVEAEWCDESRAYYMVGHFNQWYTAIANRLTAIDSSKTEKMDRYYSTEVFTAFFKQRAAYMMASPEEQAAYEGHPALYGKPQMEGFLAKDNQ